MTVVVGTDPSTAAPPPKKTITHVSDTFTCSDGNGLIGGGTLTGVLRRTTLTPLEGEFSRTRFAGTYRFVADNGKHLTYRIDYFRIVLDYGDFYYETMWDGWFIVYPVDNDNYWYADPGEARFTGGGYIVSPDPAWRSVCEELGYDTGWDFD